MFTPYSQLTPEAQAVLKLKVRMQQIRLKNRRAIRVVSNAIAHLEGRWIPEDCRQSVKEIWPSLGKNRISI